MATITFFTDNVAAVEKFDNENMVAAQKIDFTKKNVLTSDVVQLVNILKDTLVDYIRVIVDTVEGGAVTADFGDAADPNGWLAALDLNALATARTDVSAASSLGFKLGKLYTADDTIDLVPSAALANAIIRIFVYGNKVAV